MAKPVGEPATVASALLAEQVPNLKTNISVGIAQMGQMVMRWPCIIRRLITTTYWAADRQNITEQLQKWSRFIPQET